MTRPAEPSRVVLWIVLSIVALFIIGIGACAICVFTNPDIKKVFSQIQKMETKTQAAEELRASLEKYVTTKHSWPNQLSDLAGDLSPEAARLATESYSYKKPADSDPPDTVVIWTKPGDSSRMLDYKIEIDKSFKGWIVTKQPLDKRGGFNLSDN